MTVSSRIVEWLKTFRLEESENIRQIDTDLMHGNVNYALVKEPVANVKKFISGAEVHKEHYQILARLDTQTNADCVDNGAWLEALTEWIEKKNRAKEFPVLEGADVRKIGIANPFYMGKNEQEKSIYQMTIFIEYFKKGE